MRTNGCNDLLPLGFLLFLGWLPLEGLAIVGICLSLLLLLVQPLLLVKEPSNLCKRQYTVLGNMQAVSMVEAPTCPRSTQLPTESKAKVLSFGDRVGSTLWSLSPPGSSEGRTQQSCGWTACLRQEPIRPLWSGRLYTGQDPSGRLRRTAPAGRF